MLILANNVLHEKMVSVYMSVANTVCLVLNEIFETMKV